MKRKHLFFVVVLIFTCGFLQAQPKRICVMGSSTAYGYFPNTSIPRDSAWAFKISKYYKELGIIDTLYNIATPGIDCYTGMPTGYTPPLGRNNPDPSFNITRAVNFNPAPDIIIINFPSNGYTVLSETEIIQCLQTMKDYANARNIRCFITTTQPRNDFLQQAEREKLRTLKALIEATFGVYSIDFWTDLVLDPPIIINPLYNLGDGVHLTPDGHTLLKNRVILRDIFFQPVAINPFTVYGYQYNNNVLLSFNTTDSIEGKQVCGERWSKALKKFVSFTDWEIMASKNYQRLYIDENPAWGDNLYRVAVKHADGTVEYSKVVLIRFSLKTLSVKPLVYPNPATDEIRITIPVVENAFQLKIIDNNGRIIKQQKIPPSIRPETYKFNLKELSSGRYFLVFPGSELQPVSFIRL